MLVYELRNRVISNAVGKRVTGIEKVLFADGPLVPAPGERDPLRHALGIALIYGAALGGWLYLVAWALLRLAGAGGHARPFGLAIGAALGAAACLAVFRIEEQKKEQKKAPKEGQETPDTPDTVSQPA